MRKATDLTSSLTAAGAELDWRVLSADPVLADRLKKLALRADDFDEHFARSAGPGGQHVNKVSTAVTVVYRPLGISVTAAGNALTIPQSPTGDS